MSRELGVPIGLIQSAWGGTIAEAWTSAEALEPLGDFKASLAAIRTKLLAGKTKSHSQLYDEWYVQHEDGSKQGWEKLGVNVADWQTVRMPQSFAGIGLDNFDGTAWFRYEFTVPKTGSARRRSWRWVRLTMKTPSGSMAWKF